MLAIISIRVDDADGYRSATVNVSTTVDMDLPSNNNNPFLALSLAADIKPFPAVRDVLLLALDIDCAITF